MMDVPGNLVSDSSLVQETFELLLARAGPVACTEIADAVLRLSHADQSLAALLVADLVRNDPRFRVNGQYLEIIHDERETQPLGEIEFVVLDVEALVTPRLPPRIIELGAHRVISGRILEEFQTLINPERPLSWFVTSLTGITDRMLVSAPNFAAVVHEWLRFAGDAILVAHNTVFDLPLLNREIGSVFAGYRMRNGELCTMNLARRVIPELKSHNLDSLADHFAIPINRRHRAATDALAAAQILLRLLGQLEEHGVRSLAEARDFRLKPYARKCETSFSSSL